MTDTTDARASHLRSLIDAYQVSQAISVMATLGLADVLEDNPRTTDELAEAVDADALLRLLRALVAVDLVSAQEGDSFALTPMGQLLCSDHPRSLSSWAIHAGQPSMWAAWSQLLRSVQTGEPAFPHVHGMDIWTYREHHPAVARVFADAMASAEEEVAARIVDAYTFGGANLIVDVGGGRGALLAAILGRYPALEGLLLEMPVISDHARMLFDAAQIGDRCWVVEGDFFESVPAGGDLYILKGVLHDWDDAHARAILQSCWRNMKPGSKLLVIELAPGDEPGIFSRFLDLHMLVIHGGKERSRAEFELLLRSAGFVLQQVIPTSVGLTILEATPG